MNGIHLRRLFCTRMKSQSTAARTPVLESVNCDACIACREQTYPSSADIPMTSRLAIRSLRCSNSISSPYLRRAASCLLRYHSS